MCLKVFILLLLSHRQAHHPHQTHLHLRQCYATTSYNTASARNLGIKERAHCPGICHAQMVEFLTLDTERKMCVFFFLVIFLIIDLGDIGKDTHRVGNSNKPSCTGNQIINWSWPMKLSSYSNHTHTTPSTPPLSVTNTHTDLHPL